MGNILIVTMMRCVMYQEEPALKDVTILKNVMMENIATLKHTNAFKVTYPVESRCINQHRG